MARIKGVPAGHAAPSVKIAYWFTRRHFARLTGREPGRGIEPLQIYAHVPGLHQRRQADRKARRAPGWHGFDTPTPTRPPASKPPRTQQNPRSQPHETCNALSPWCWGPPGGREEDARKLRCPVRAYLLPSKHDVLEHRETRRVHAAVLAARACPEHQDGCRLRPLSQRRQPPRGISRGAVFIYLGSASI